MTDWFEFAPITIDKLEFKNVQYHRNGVSGTGFFCAVAYDPEAEGDMLITYFPDIKGECCCAVYKLDILPDITFGKNSWRGDKYAGKMADAISEYHKQFNAWLEK